MDYEQDNRSNGPAPETSQAETAASPISALREGGYQRWTLAALSPFIFIALGFMFGWWAWAWMIIPVSAILSAPTGKYEKMVGLSPFLFLALGFAFNWWAWAWMVIPVSAILYAGAKR